MFSTEWCHVKTCACTSFIVIQYWNMCWYTIFWCKLSTWKLSHTSKEYQVRSIGKFHCQLTCREGVDGPWSISNQWTQPIVDIEPSQPLGSLQSTSIENENHIWLVVSTYPSEKNEFVRLDHHPNYWGKLKIHVPNHQPELHNLDGWKSSWNLEGNT